MRFMHSRRCNEASPFGCRASSISSQRLSASRLPFASLFFVFSFSVPSLLSFSPPSHPFTQRSSRISIVCISLSSVHSLLSTQRRHSATGHPSPLPRVMQASHAQNLLFWRAKPTPPRGQVVMVRRSDTRQQTAMWRQPSAEARGRQRRTMGWAGLGWAGSVTGRLTG